MGNRSDRLFRTPSAALEAFLKDGGRHQPPGPEAETLKPRSNPQQGVEVMITKEQARARGALQHLMYCARGDLDDADLSGLYQAEREIENLIEQSQPVPEGYVVVPMVPTDEMLKAAQTSRCCYAEFEHFMDHEGAEIEKDWRVMRSVAPKPGADDE